MSELMRRDPSSAPVAYEPRSENIWIDGYLDEKESEAARYVQIVLRRKWLVIAVALLVLGLAGARTYNMPRQYTSKVRLQIDPEQNVLPYREIYDSVTADPRYLGTQAQVLKSEVLARRIVTRLDPTSDPEQTTRRARFFVTNVQVTPIEATQVVEVSYMSEDPGYAATAINALADEYVEYSFETKHDATTRARDLLEQELAKLQHRLAESEQELVRYGLAKNILLPTENNNVIMEKLNQLNQEMRKVETEVLSNQYHALRDITLDSFPEKLKTGVLKELDSRRSGLEQKLAIATQRFGPKWPEVLTLKQELADVHQQLANEQRKVLEQAKAEYDLSVAHRDRLATALGAQNSLANQLTQDSIQYYSLKREVETTRQLHEGLLQRLKETDISAGLKSANVHVIDRGHVPTLPSSPNVPRNMALGLMLGLAAGIMLAVVLDHLDRTVKSPEDVERDLRLPFLGAIPAFENSWKEATGGLLMAIDTRAGQDKSAAHLTSEAEVYWESYRSLRTSLLFSSPEGRPHSILVTSAMPGEGKSTTVANLAVALAQTGARTLILELDLRRPRLAEIFELPGKHGISRYLSGQSDLNTEIHQTAVPNLFVIPSGPVPPNPPELIGSARMTTAFEWLGRNFEYILVDAPPLMAVSDALIVSRQVGGVIMVVHGGKTPKEAVQKARNLLMSINAKILGTLVNNVKMDRSQLYYSAIYSQARDTYLAAPGPPSLQLK